MAKSLPTIAFARPPSSQAEAMQPRHAMGICSQPAPTWAPIQERDLKAAAALGDRIHRDYPEDFHVVRRRFELYPSGFYALKNDALVGYAVFHPWRSGRPPMLNQYLSALPDGADCIHLHDIVVAEPHRGNGHSRRFMAILDDHAKDHRYAAITLVAVSGAEGVWERFGFREAGDREARSACLSYSSNSVYMVKNV